MQTEGKNGGSMGARLINVLVIIKPKNKIHFGKAFFVINTKSPLIKN